MTAAPRRSLALVAALAACAVIPATAQGAVYQVDQAGVDVGDCTVAPCATVEYALDQHRLNPDPTDVIDVGTGTFVGNVGADQLEDDGLLIRGTLDGGGTRQTTLRGVDDGVDGFGYAVSLGLCDTANVTLRDLNVDTQGAFSDTAAIEALGGSDLRNVHASNQAGSDAFSVVDVCERGTEIRKSTIDATGSPAGVAGIVGLDGFQLIDSHVRVDTGPGIFHLAFFGGTRTLVVKRSWLEGDPANTEPGIYSNGDVILDSSLVTGGETGLIRDNSFPLGARWKLRNATIDVGNPGAYDVGLADLLLSADDGDGRIDVSVVNSILAEEIVSEFFSAPGPGSVSCSHTDVQLVDIDPTFTDDCVVGADGNTTTDPADQFVGGAPFDWSLLETAPAIQAGTPGLVPAQFSQTDLAGNPRRAAPAAADCPTPIVDMGAYEFASVPCNKKLPQVKNGASPTVGSQLGANPGKWTNQPTSFQNRWLRCDAAGANCAAIMAYRSNHRGYTPSAADVGSTLRVEFIATNGSGASDPVASDPTGVVGP